MKRYPKYKDSGVAWLGEVPAHWEVKRLAGLFRQINEEGEPDLPILSVSIHDGVSDSELDEKEMDRKVTRSDDKSKYKKVLPGDLVYNMMRAWQGGFGTVAVAGMVSPAYVVARPLTGFRADYVENLLRTPQAVEQMRRHSQGVTDFRLRLYWEEFKSINVSIPPRAEQDAIAAFLDRETAKIDELVAEQRRLIELLREKRQAVISHAVTKGLNPDAPMKPSGIEWLGDIPANWEVKSLKRLVQRGRRITYGIVQPGLPDPNGRYMIRGKDYSNGWCDPDDIFRVSDAIEIPYTRSRMKTGDLVITIVGAGVGTVAVLPEWLDGSNITQTTARIAIESAVLNSEYACLALESVVGRRNLQRHVYGSAQPRLNIEHVDAYLMTVPPISEQNEIVRETARRLDEFSVLLAEAERAIVLLQERRTALISAAVTGKVDVRATVKGLK